MRQGTGIIFILITVGLDAMGIGLIMPVLPALLRALVHSDQIAGHYGLLLTLYALMQFFFAPILGGLSDRFGRKPVLLVALAGAALDYTIMSLAPVLWILYIGRLIAGISSATQSIAAAYIADLSSSNERAKFFGYLSACTGLGFIAGPVIGGLMGHISPQAPFMVAAVLNGLNFLCVYLFLPESHREVLQSSMTSSGLNLLSTLQGFLRTKAFRIPLFIFFTIQLIGQIPTVLWVIFCEERFHWHTATIGLSLAWYGVLHALVQAFLTGRMTAYMGEKRAVFFAMISDCLGYTLFAFATQGWMVIPIMLFFGLGSIGTPSLQAWLSNQVKEEIQGELQGSLTSLMSLFDHHWSTGLHDTLYGLSGNLDRACLDCRHSPWTCLSPYPPSNATPSRASMTRP